MYAPKWGSVSPWFFTDIHAQAMSLPDPKTLEYVKDYNMVKSLGKHDSTSRSSDDTEIGVFWAYDGAFNIGTPPRLFQQTVDAIVKKLDRGAGRRKVDSGLKLLKLYAVVSGAMADACIAAWYEKYKWNYWRPVVGIRFTPGLEGAEPDETWKPFGLPLTDVLPKAANIPQVPISATGRTPMFPAYPSGHATMGAATLHAAMSVLQIPETFTFSLTSDELNGKTKDQSGLTRPNSPRSFTIKEAIEENNLSRVYLGVHWIFDTDQGALLGSDIGQKVASTFPTLL
jgi:hypothetical protein